MIIATPWGCVPNGARVVLSTGRVVHVLPRVPGLPGVVGIRTDHGKSAVINVDPSMPVPQLIEQQDVAVATLREAFPDIEYLMEVRS